MEKIRIKRIKMRLTQDTLAKKAGLSQLTINNIENGHTKPSITTLEKIALALETNVKNLLS